MGPERVVRPLEREESRGSAPRSGRPGRERAQRRPEFREGKGQEESPGGVAFQAEGKALPKALGWAPGSQRRTEHRRSPRAAESGCIEGLRLDPQTRRARPGFLNLYPGLKDPSVRGVEDKGESVPEEPQLLAACRSWGQRPAAW